MKAPASGGRALSGHRSVTGWSPRCVPLGTSHRLVTGWRPAGPLECTLRCSAVVTVRLSNILCIVWGPLKCGDPCSAKDVEHALIRHCVMHRNGHWTIANYSVQSFDMLQQRDHYFFVVTAIHIPQSVKPLFVTDVFRETVESCFERCLELLQQVSFGVEFLWIRLHICPDDEMEEVDVVSVTSCGWSGDFPVAGPPPGRRQMMVLPAAESMSAQVAAMHNYSNPRCRPMPTPRSTTSISCPAKYVHLSKRVAFLLQLFSTYGPN